MGSEMCIRDRNRLWRLTLEAEVRKVGGLGPAVIDVFRACRAKYRIGQEPHTINVDDRRGSRDMGDGNIAFEGGHGAVGLGRLLGGIIGFTQ